MVGVVFDTKSRSDITKSRSYKNYAAGFRSLVRTTNKSLSREYFKNKRFFNIYLYIIYIII